MNCNEQAGITLVELLVVTALVTAMMILAPAILDFASNARIRHHEQQLYLLIQQARMHATTQRMRVTICPLNESNTCHRNWNAPISSFGDLNGNRRLDSGESLITTLPSLSLVEVSWNGMGGNRAIHFNLHGHTSVTNGRMRLCRHGQVIRDLVLNRQGRLRRSVIEDSQC